MSNLALAATYYGATAYVPKDNPSFNFQLKQDLPYITVPVIVSNGEACFKEDFKVSRLEDAERQAKEIIKFFNDTLQPGEKPREFVELYKDIDDEMARYGDGEGVIGWLTPDGVFHNCGFGGHAEFAVLQISEDKINLNFNVMDEMEELTHSQYIPFSTWEQSTYGSAGIIDELTEKQVDWINKMFYKLDINQRSVVQEVAKKQGIKLKYWW